MTCSSELDERTLREIYLSAFETVVKEAHPWTMMCSYNRVNGVFASENRHLLTRILREEWGFDGFVMSDWGAVNDRVKGLAAGLDLEMPGSGGINDARIVAAVREGRLDEAVVDRRPDAFWTWFSATRTGSIPMPGLTGRPTMPRRRNLPGSARCCCKTTACCR